MRLLLYRAAQARTKARRWEGVRLAARAAAASKQAAPRALAGRPSRLRSALHDAT